jgi:hypothetical protein
VLVTPSDSRICRLRSVSSAAASNAAADLDVARQLAAEGSKAFNRKVEVRRNAARAAGRA